MSDGLCDAGRHVSAPAHLIARKLWAGFRPPTLPLAQSNSGRRLCFQVPNEAGECRRCQPLQSVLAGHPDPAGPPGRGPHQHHRPNRKRDQPAAPLGGELGGGGPAWEPRA